MPLNPERLFYARAFALLGLLGLGYLLYLVLSPFLAPIAWALFIAFLIYPLHRRLVRRLGGRAALSAVLLTVLVFLVVIGPLTGLGAAFAQQATDLTKYVQEFVVEHKPATASDLAELP